LNYQTNQCGESPRIVESGVLPEKSYHTLSRRHSFIMVV